MLDHEQAARVTIILASVAAAISGLEHLWITVYRPSGFFSCTARLWMSEATPLRRVLRDRSLLMVLRTAFALQFGGSIACAFAAGLQSAGLVFVVGGLSLIHLCAAFLRPVGGDGAGQMSLIIIFAAALSMVLLGPAEYQQPFLHFVAFQGLLAYLTAGVAKLVSRDWWRGDVLAKIAATESYGCPWLSRLLDRTPVLGRALCYSVIVLEMSMPLVLLGNTRVTVILLTLGLAFHIVTAWTMGLNDFPWAFAATYPAMLVVSVH